MLGTCTYICICNLTIYMKKDCPRLLFYQREIWAVLLLAMINARVFERNRFQKDHKEHGMLWTLTMEHSISFQQNKTSVLLNKVLLLWLKHFCIICLKLATTTKKYHMLFSPSFNTEWENWKYSFYSDRFKQIRNNLHFLLRIRIIETTFLPMYF